MSDCTGIEMKGSSYLDFEGRRTRSGWVVSRADDIDKVLHSSSNSCVMRRIDTSRLKRVCRVVSSRESVRRDG
jgi:hypothetical protein